MVVNYLELFLTVSSIIVAQVKVWAAIENIEDLQIKLHPKRHIENNLFRVGGYGYIQNKVFFIVDFL